MAKGALEQDLAARGLLIEAGWVGMRAAAYPSGLPKLQEQELRAAFFAGAQHLFSSIMQLLDEDAEPTEADMARMDAIQTELDTFIAAFSKQHGLVQVQ